MKKKQIIILSVIVILLAGYIYFIERKKITTDDVAQLQNKIISVPFNEIMEIRIADIVLKKAGIDTWTIAAPIKCSIDFNEAENVFTVMKNADFIAKQNVNYEEIKKLKITDSPAIVILDKNGKAVVFKRGIKNFDGTFNILNVNDTTIYTARPDFADLFDLKLKRLRDKKVFAFPTSDVLSLTIERSKNDVLSFVKQQLNEIDYEWNIVSPQKTEGSWDKINEIIDMLVHSTAIDFIDNPAKQIGGGLETPITINLKKNDGSIYSLKTIFIKNKTEENRYYLKKDNEQTVFVLNNQNLYSKLFDRFITFKSEKIFGKNFSDSALLTITVKYNLKTIELKNENGKFILNGNYDTSAILPDEKSLSDFTTALADFKAEAIISDNSKDLFEYNLDKPFMQLFINATTGRKTINISAAKDKLFGVLFSGAYIEIFEITKSADGKTPQFTEAIIKYF